MAEDEMVGCHHRLNGCEFEQALRVGEGQGSLACCSPWGRKELDMIERLNNNKMDIPAAFIGKPSGETRTPEFPGVTHVYLGVQ